MHYPSYYTYCSKKVYHTVNFYYCAALPIIPTVLKKQACNIYKYRETCCMVLSSHDFRLRNFFRYLQKDFELECVKFVIQLKIFTEMETNQKCTNKSRRSQTIRSFHCSRIRIKSTISNSTN